MLKIRKKFQKIILLSVALLIKIRTQTYGEKAVFLKDELRVICVVPEIQVCRSFSYLLISIEFLAFFLDFKIILCLFFFLLTFFIIASSGFVIEKILVINDKEIPPIGFSTVYRTVDTEQKAWRKKQICFRLLDKRSISKAITDIIVCYRSLSASDHFQLAG